MDRSNTTKACSSSVSAVASTATVIAGIGSPHGDDRAGWAAIEMLAKLDSVPARLLTIGKPLDLLAHLSGCRVLYVIDACVAGQPAGTVTRVGWKNDLAGYSSCHSSHGFGLSEALRLATRLGTLPPEVILYSMEVTRCDAGTQISDEVRQAIPELVREIADDLSRTSAANRPVWNEDAERHEEGRTVGTTDRLRQCDDRENRRIR